MENKIKIKDNIEIMENKDDNILKENEKENEKEIDLEKKRYYDIFEKITGKKAYWKGQETKLFEAWYENLMIKENESIKCIIRYFPDENSMICQDFQLKFKEIELDENNNMIWSLTPKSKKHILKDIAYTILSIPVYHITPNSKNSVKLFLDEVNDDLYDYGCSSFDQYNKLHSDILTKNLKTLIGKLYNKWTVYFVILLFIFLITCLPFFPFVFPKYFVN